MSFGTPPEFDPLREQNMLDKAYLWAEKWFETSPYAPYVPYALGALAMATRFWMSRRMMNSTVKKNEASKQAGTATGTAPTPVAAAPTASGSGKGGAVKRRK